MYLFKDACKNFISILMLTAFSISIPAAESDSDRVTYMGIEVFNTHLTTSAGDGKVVTARPGETVYGFAEAQNLCPERDPERILIVAGLGGVYDVGMQDYLNIGSRNFQLKAPNKPGIYEVRFRYAQAFFSTSRSKLGLRFWWSDDVWWTDVNAPAHLATIGIIIVSEDGSTPTDTDTPDNDNWKDWLKKKHAYKTLPVLKGHMVQSPDFWNISTAYGGWTTGTNTVRNKGTNLDNFWRKYYQISSKDAYKQFDLKVTTRYQRTNQIRFRSDANLVQPPQGFAILYYINDKQNVEFRYIPGNNQLSLYIKDDKKVIELNKYAKLGASIAHDISVHKGIIHWKVNGNTVFKNKTSLKQGHLMLTNYNNSTTFTFDD